MSILAALEAPGVFKFAELFDAPSSDSDPVSHAQLRIFCAGTWGDYAASSLPPLPPRAAAKLRQLTIASMAAEQRTLTFSDMRSNLGLEVSATHSLEDLIVDGIDAGLFTGRIDAVAETFDVFSTRPREVLPTSETRAHLRDVLAAWYVARLTRRVDAQNVLEVLRNDISRLQNKRNAATATRAQHHDALVRALNESRPQMPSDSAGPRAKRSRP